MPRPPRTPATTRRRTAAREKASAAAVALLAAFATSGPARAQEPEENGDPLAALAHHSEFEAALDALADDLPGVAAAKLRRVLEVKNLPDPAAAEVRLRLLEACVRAGETTAALEVAGEVPAPAPPRARFWTAHARAAGGELEAASAEFGAVASAPGTDPGTAAEARLAQSSLLAALGSPEDALAVLQPLLAPPGGGPEGGGSASPGTQTNTDPEPAADPDDARHRTRAALQAAEIHLAQNRSGLAQPFLAQVADPPADLVAPLAYLSATAALADDDPAGALAALDSIPSATGVPTDLAAKVTLARASAHIASGDARLAAQQLIGFVSENPSTPFLPSAFQLLEEADGFASPENRAILEGWETNPSPALSALAVFYRARALNETGDTEAALAALAAFPVQTAPPALAARADLELATWLIESGDPRGARAALDRISGPGVPPEVAAHASFLRARALYAGGDFATAAESFGNTGTTGEVDASAEATYNAAIAALRARQEEEFEAFSQVLESIPGAKTSHVDLALQRALFAAAERAPDAADRLAGFIANHPDAPGAFRAHLALAEIYVLDFFPPKTQSARDEIASAREKLTSFQPQVAQRLAHLDVIVAEAAGETTEAIQLAGAFLTDWPESPLRAKVQMKLGDLYYRTRDYANARLQFEKINDENPGSEFAEPALFLAAEAALQMITPTALDTAITLWQKVADKKGPLELEARRRQAVAKHRTGAEDEAIQIYDSILTTLAARSAAAPGAGTSSALPPAAQVADLRSSVLIGKGEALFSAAHNDPENVAAAIEAFDAVLRDPITTSARRSEALYRKARALSQVGRTGEALEVYYDAINSHFEPGAATAGTPTTDVSPGQSWAFLAGFDAIALLEGSGQWSGAIRIADRLARSGGSRAAEAREVAERLRLEHFVWDDPEEP